MTTLNLTIQGMSCGHCLAAVRKAVESVPGVTVRALQLGRAEVDAPDAAARDAIKAAVEDAGYYAEVVER
jgi:copper chaperone CopZ